MGKMQQCFGMCQDGPNATVFWSVSRWAKYKSVLECAKRNQMQQCAKMGKMQAFWNVPRPVKCSSVLECVKMGKTQKMFLMFQDGPNATMFLAV